MTQSTPSNLDFDQMTPDQMTNVIDGFLNKGLALQNLQEISDESMEELYRTGYNLYNGGRPQDAESMFQYLCILNHWQKKYWMGLAAARQVQKKYSEAIDAYSMAGLLEITDPNVPFQAAICHLGLGNVDKATHALEGAVELSENNNDLRSKAQGLLATLKTAHKAS